LGTINEEFFMTASNRSFTFLVFVAAFVLLLTGCASSAVLIGKARPAISPEQVKLYLRPPKKFEEIALLESSSRNSWAITSQGKMDTVIQRLKEEAAKLGANGILIQGTGSEYGGSVNTGVGTATATGNTAYGTGFGTSVAVFHKAGSGVAIYVEEE
jgi:hypothetical protein